MFEILKADFAVNYYNFVNLGKFRCFGTVLAHSICYNGSKSLIILLIPDWYYSAYESKNEVETMKELRNQPQLLLLPLQRYSHSP